MQIERFLRYFESNFQNIYLSSTSAELSSMTFAVKIRQKGFHIKYSVISKYSADFVGRAHCN